MKIKFIGTGGSEGIPAIYCRCEVCEHARAHQGKYIRTRAGLMIDDELLIDFSPDLYMNSIKYNIYLSKIQGVLFTHSHGDHFFPMDLLARSKHASINREVEVLNVYGNTEIYERMEREGWQRSKIIAQSVKMTTLESGKTYEIVGGYLVTPFKTEHIPTEDCFIYLIQKDGKNYLQCHDSGEPYDCVLEELQKRGVKLDMLVMDCTYGMMEQNYGGHMNLNQNIKVKKKMEELGLIDEHTIVYATHIAHCGGSYAAIEEKANANGILVAYDGLEVGI